jgi:hypothetical protein
VKLLIKFREEKIKPGMIFASSVLIWGKDGKDIIQWNLIMQEHRLKMNVVKMVAMRIPEDLDAQVRVESEQL